ncbi:hypothetical protein HYDPIDRAFT_117517 [Hydnomerulius pinastri MD-312]|uniref:Uncharacterized protein n=1 Tax=Hydnomerulius pinastri MD-312 TaxID=994086 RepID=A0A0C9W2N6_9AGAM|nr:hypothetical protein HYDPIDRAFT_117517 [Hydnomerulius pinastri MD-312]
MAYINPGDLVMRTGGAGSGQHYARVANPPVHPSSTHSPMPQFYALFDQRRTERVPRPVHISPPQESIPAITFTVNGWPGVRVRDMLKDNVIIDAPHDAVFAHHGWRATIVNLQWPGYDLERFKASVLSRFDTVVGNTHITRQQVAREVCGLVQHFHRVVSKQPIAPGWEKWALTTGTEGIRPNDVVVLSIHYYRNMWVPELYVIE